MKVDKRLKKLAPVWSKAIQNAKEPIELSMIESEIDLNLTDRCIVGEVYGWCDYKCKTCSDLGFHIWSWSKSGTPYDFVDDKKNLPKSFHQAIKQFIDHWEKIHARN